MVFAELFPASAGGAEIDRFSPEALAGVSYDLELELKNRALKRLLTDGGIAVAPAPVVPSPKPRSCRTTGKRRVTCSGGKIFFHMGRTHGKEPVAASRLEAPGHQEIYAALHRQFALPRNRAAAAALNYCILRGNYAEHALIFNVRRLDGGIVRSLRTAAETVAAALPALRSAFIYVDESSSDYYLEAERPERGKVAFKKLFGPEFLAMRLPGRKLLYPATVFSQSNESILPVFLETLKKHLAPAGPESALLDLYCGYGLWSLALGDDLGHVWGAELSPEAVKAARSNAAFHFKDRDFRYEALSITAEALKEKLPPAGGRKEIVLLDPPRKGCAPGVPETLISRRPKKILHMFCGADEIVPALRVYTANGCRVEKLLPFDFFPGTMNLEVLAVIGKKQITQGDET